MSQHALKLAEAVKDLLSGDKLVQRFETIRDARSTLADYLASDEHAQDLDRARAEAAGFQGLAGPEVKP